MRRKFVCPECHLIFIGPYKVDEGWLIVKCPLCHEEWITEIG